MKNNKKIERKISLIEKSKSPRTLIEERDEIILNGRKLERGKDYNISREGKLVLKDKILEEINSSQNLTYQSFYSQKIIRN